MSEAGSDPVVFLSNRGRVEHGRRDGERTTRRGGGGLTPPVVSRRPPGNVLAALPLTLVDRSRDVLDRAARSAPQPVARSSLVASSGLAAAAGTIERLPPLQRGDDPSTRSGRNEGRP